MATRKPVLLATFIQLPQEPTSGAAKSMRTTCEFLAHAGWQVQVLGTTATEGIVRRTAEPWLLAAGIETQTVGGPHGSRFLEFHSRGVDYLIWDIGTVNSADARQVPGDPFDQIFDRLLSSLKPDVFLTYSGWLVELDRRKRARSAGTRVVFSVRNRAYQHPVAFRDIDACFSSSKYLSESYANAVGVRPDVLPLPIGPEEVLRERSSPVFATFINPEPIKGVAVFARIAEELSCRRPDLPILVVKSRCQEDLLLAIADRGGFDLRRHSNIAISDPVFDISRALAVTRVLLVPSLEEAAGRVAAEAMVNAIPVIASDRDGLPETLNGGGWFLPLPPGTSPNVLWPPSAEQVQDWVELTLELMTDEAEYARASARALDAGRRYLRDSVLPLYTGFFDAVRKGST